MLPVRDSADFYEILQVSRNASHVVMEAAWKKLAQQYHPDVNTSPDAAEMMKRLNVAYQTPERPRPAT
ncbi:MAG: J domain-containing protein [Chloroflexi bacterium]|nr:J domain-containing protein [Chloroflexota bacterium]MDA1174847.1 J domain-containing protein [Chloroflexota bacterium]